MKREFGEVGRSRWGRNADAEAAPATVSGKHATYDATGLLSGKAGRARLIRKPGDLPPRVSMRIPRAGCTDGGNWSFQGDGAFRAFRSR